MSQASNHVKWCLSKAKKEIEEYKEQGKRIKHRGLLKIKPDTEGAKKHIIKAEHNLSAISKFKAIGFSDWSIAAGFYSIYHCFHQILFYVFIVLCNFSARLAVLPRWKIPTGFSASRKSFGFSRTSLVSHFIIFFT